MVILGGGGVLVSEVPRYSLQDVAAWDHFQTLKISKRVIMDLRHRCVCVCLRMYVLMSVRVGVWAANDAASGPHTALHTCVSAQLYVPNECIVRCTLRVRPR